MKEKILFNKEEIEEEFFDYIQYDTRYANYESTWYMVDESLKEEGIQSKWRYLIAPLERCVRKEYLDISDSLNSVTEFYEAEIFNEFINCRYDDELENSDFLKQISEYVQRKYPHDKDCFKWLKK